MGIVVNQEGQPVEHARAYTRSDEQHGSTTECHGYSGKDGSLNLIIGRWEPSGSLL
jgi:hypothetical protein